MATQIGRGCEQPCAAWAAGGLLSSSGEKEPPCATQRLDTIDEVE